MMAAWPAIRRGTEAIVPIVPGLVIVTVVPAKSSGGRLLEALLHALGRHGGDTPERTGLDGELPVGASPVGLLGQQAPGGAAGNGPGMFRGRRECQRSGLGPPIVRGGLGGGGGLPEGRA